VTGNTRDTHQTGSQERWRVFCALELTSSARTRLMEHINRLRQTVPNAAASWSREQNLHLTLKFLGELAPPGVRKLSDAAAAAVTKVSSFQISIEEPGVFPKRGKPRVLWLRVKDETGMLSKLQLRLKEACAREGFAREDRPFHPHLTLARLRKPQGAHTLAETHHQLIFEPVKAEIRELLVIRSELNRDGSKYTVISRHALAAQVDESV